MQFYIPECDRIFRESPDWCEYPRQPQNTPKGTRSDPSGAKLEGRGVVPFTNISRWFKNQEK